MVYEAIKIGYRLLDGASDYGNEKEAGEGLRRAIKDGIVKREEICKPGISCAIWNQALTELAAACSRYH